MTFETDLHTSLELATSFEQEPVYISESAISHVADARMLAPYLMAFSLGQPHEGRQCG